MDYPLGKSRCFDVFKTLFFWSENHYFYPEYKKTFFCDLITPRKKTQIKKFDFWTKTMDQALKKMSCLALCRTIIFWSKTHSFLSKIISKNNLHSLVFSQKKWIKKSLMFGHKPWNIPFGKCRCFALLKTLFFWSKNHSFLSKISKKQSFLTWLNQKTQIKRNSIFGQ